MTKWRNYQSGRGEHETLIEHATLAWRVFPTWSLLASAGRNSPPLCSSHTMIPLLHPVLVSLLAILVSVSAYIPAVPTNDTTLAIQGGLNVTDVSKVYLQWYSTIG